MPNPHTHSGKRDSDVQPTEWPAVTASLLADHERLASIHSPGEINAPLFALIRARKAINDARLACNRARLLHTNPLLRDRLESIAAALVQEMNRFPVSIIGQPLARRTPRPK